jgi:hypothetical protein
MKGKAMLLKNVIATTALAVAFAATPALSQTVQKDGPLPYEKWDNSTRSMFFDGMTLRTEADIRAAWVTLPPERQATLRLDCETFPEPGSSDLTELPNDATGNPVPGVNDQARACALIRTM